MSTIRITNGAERAIIENMLDRNREARIRSKFVRRGMG